MKYFDHYDLMFAADFYKVSHQAQYSENITRVHSVMVARGANYNDHISPKECMWFGVKLYVHKLRGFCDWFFDLDEDEINEKCTTYKDFLDKRLGGDNDVSHWKELWELGHLPINIHAMPERRAYPFQTPLLTVENTDINFRWLTSYVESTVLSNIWGATTAANRAWHIRKSIEDAMKDHTEDERAAIDFMGHDFALRGIIGD